jgi:hypothetical protein
MRYFITNGQCTHTLFSVYIDIRQFVASHPCSALLERLFSAGSQILTPRRQKRRHGVDMPTPLMWKGLF